MNWLKNKMIMMGWIVPLASIVITLLIPAVPSHATQTIPYKMNFQGKIANATGVPLSNGVYNMRFRIFDAASGGTLLWSEQRAVSAGTGVTVTNGGLFSTQLGDVTALPSIFTNQNLFFEIELPTPATATCSAVNCASYTEGPMTPRNKLGSSAYAFNSDLLDGIDSSGFIQNTGSPQSASFNITGTGTVGGLTVGGGALVRTTSSTALQVQNASSAALLTVDTSNSQIVVGSPTNGVLLSASGIQLVGTARTTRTVELSPEYPGATFTGDGTTNNGTLSSDFCSGSSRMNINAAACSSMATRNYYQWTTTQSTAQDYDIYVRYQLPDDYDTGSMVNLAIMGWGTTTATEFVAVAMHVDSQGAACTTSTNAVAANAAWAKVTIASPLGACTPVAGDIITFRVRLQAGQNNIARAGPISFSYRGKM